MGILTCLAIKISVVVDTKNVILSSDHSTGNETRIFMCRNQSPSGNFFHPRAAKTAVLPCRIECGGSDRGGTQVM